MGTPSTLRFDCKGEFSSKEFKSVSEACGIQISLMTHYSPQQNSMRERELNHPLVRSILQSKKILKEFLDEVMACVVSLLNRCLAKSLENIIP